METGAKRVIASAAQWPGWTRAGKTEAEALEALAAYRDRYAEVVEAAGLRPPPAEPTFAIVEHGTIGDAYASMGIPTHVFKGDREPTGAVEARHLVALLEGGWKVFDRVAAHAPAKLRKGPRGGGRDRDAVHEHVIGAENGYARVLGIKQDQAKHDDKKGIKEMREALVELLSKPWDGTPYRHKSWPPRYAVRRLMWHALDHAWEIEDKSAS